MSENDENLVKIVVDLPNHWATGGESMWARALGDDLYEIRNVPFFAYGLNFLDVVRAIEPEPDKKPVACNLVRPSGHRTLRVWFSDTIASDRRTEMLSSLNELKAYFEGADGRLFAIDVEPEGNYEAVCDRLARWESAHFLEYETCEARMVGSFDDVSEEIG